MADKQVSQVAPPQEPEERVPVFQQILDNPFLLLFLGVVSPTVLYILWGVMEIAGIPVTPLAQ
ncbi:MAG: hypothetical protein ROZ64_00350 [Burkholderiaceae bacterium]|jgi:hypothetical protein|nr:hypothetical protein [Burkholderiaceae bacterium]MDT3677270.1 hypothetical protein [Burkholderiaceae bacterium]